MLEKLRNIYHRLPRPPSTNYYLGQLAHNPYAMLPEGALVLDVGAKNARGRYSFATATDTERLQIVALDIEPAEGVNLVADAHRLPLKSQSVDCVTCVSVLEYVRYPQQVIVEMFRILKPGGLIYINIPFIFPFHPEPGAQDLYRFSMSGIRVLCESFEEIQTGYNRGPASTMCDLLVYFNAILFCFNNKRLYGLLLDLFQWCLFWLKYLDRWIGHYEVAKVIHSGTFFLGRKSSSIKSKTE